MMERIESNRIPVQERVATHRRNVGGDSFIDSLIENENEEERGRKEERKRERS